MSSTPVQDVANSIEVGQVYVDTRQDDLPDGRERDYYTVIYCDHERVYLRSQRPAGRGRDNHHHRAESRSSFEQMAATGRYELRPDMDSKVDVGNLARVKERADEYRERDGRKYTHYADAMEEAVALLTGDESPDDAEEVEFESLSHIGEKTASNLRDAGIVTRGDVRSHDDSELLDVGGVGQAGLNSIRDAV